MTVQQSIGDETERIIEDCLYSAKSHLEASRLWGKAHLGLGLPAAILSGIAGVSALSNEAEVAAVIAFLVAAVTGAATFLNPEKRAANHHAAGSQYHELRNRARVFLTIDLPQLAENPIEATAAVKVLAASRDELNAASPPIPRWAFVRARIGIEAGEALHAVDEQG